MATMSIDEYDVLRVQNGVISLRAMGLSDKQIAINMNLPLDVIQCVPERPLDQAVSIRDVSIWWSPANSPLDTAGKIQVARFPRRPNGDYLNDWGACWSAIRNETDDGCLCYEVVRKALAMILRDGLDPKAVHKALSVIEEYNDADLLA